MKLPKIVSHRGVSNKAIENTLEAFELALIEGADYIEGDFWLTKDDKIVCIHDITLTRVTNGKSKLNVTKSTFESLIRVNYLNEFFSQRYSIPILEDVIKIIPEGKGLQLEIKDNRRKFLDVLKKILVSLDFPRDKLIIISYHFDILKYSKLILSDIKTFCIVDSFFMYKNCRSKNAFELFAQVSKDIKIDGIVLNIESNLNKYLVQRLLDLNLEIGFYGVNDSSSVFRMLDLGINYITTDNIPLVKEAFFAYQKNLV